MTNFTTTDSSFPSTRPALSPAAPPMLDHARPATINYSNDKNTSSVRGYPLHSSAGSGIDDRASTETEPEEDCPKLHRKQRSYDLRNDFLNGTVGQSKNASPRMRAYVRRKAEADN